MTYTFPAQVAWNVNGSVPVKNATFQVYAVTDTTYTTPLAITDATGNPITGNILNSGIQGVFPQFGQATNATVVITDAAHVYAWTLNCIPSDASTAAFINAAGSATQTALSATYALQTSLGGPGTTRLTAANTQKWRTALAKVRTGGGDAKLLTVGDSTVAGITIASALTDSWPIRAMNMLDTTATPYTPALAVPYFTGTTNDTRWTPGTGWPLSRNFGFASYSGWQATAPAGTLVFADSRITADRFDVYYLDSPVMGTLNLTATGMAVVNQSCGGSSYSIKKVTVPAAAAGTANSLTIGATGNQVFVLAVEPWLSTGSRVRVANAGVSSSSTTDWNSAAAVPYGGVDAIKAYAPDLTLICLGTNDGINSVPVSTYTTNILAIAAASAVTGDVILVTPVPSQNPPEATYIPLYQAAMLGTTYPVIDLTGYFGTWAAANTLGLMVDGHHPNTVGYAYIGAFIKQALAQL